MLFIDSKKLFWYNQGRIIGGAFVNKYVKLEYNEGIIACLVIDENGMVSGLFNEGAPNPSVYIPSFLNDGTKITGISRAFCQAHHFNVVIISDEIDYVEPGAFHGASVNHVVWPAACTYIPDNCFLDSFVKVVSNIDHVKAIGKMAFAFANCIDRIDFSASSITHMGDSAFEGAIAGNIVWPTACSHIPDLCFFNSSVKGISNLDNIKTIGERAFCGMHEGECIDFSSSPVVYAGNDAFNCSRDFKLPYLLS